MLHSLRWFALAFLVLAGTQFVILGPRRAIQGALDLAAPYAGTRAWVHGLNPYDHAIIADILYRSGREADAVPAFTPALYLPPTFVALLPLAPLTWPVARATWLLTCLVLFAFALRSLVRLAKMNPNEPGALLVAGGALALAPFATGIALGQLAIASIALIVIATERIKAGSHTGTGLLLGLALLLKPQVAGPFVLYFLIRGPRRPAAMGLGLYSVAALASTGSLWMTGVHWLPTWIANSRAELEGGGIDPRGPLSAQMVDPRPLLSALFDFDAPIWIGATIALTVACVLTYLGRRLGRAHGLLLVGNIAVLSLFAGYHRFYDAAVLCLPLTWAIATARRRDPLRRLALGAVLCIAPFFVSGAWTLQRLSNEAVIPNSVADSFFWNAFVLRHQTWALLSLQGVLLAAVWRAAKAQNTGSAGD